MSDSPYIFISHSRRNDDFAQYLAARLREAGLRPWIDVDSIPDGSTWPREIQKAVEGCAALVVIMSKAGRESEWVERETLLALELNRPVLIALIEDVPLPLHLLNRQATDFRNRPEAALTRLIGALHRAITEGRPPPSGPAPSPDPNAHNFFRYVEQFPDGRTCARIARSLHAWAGEHASAVTFSGRARPAMHTHLWHGPGGLTLFSVRTYTKEPAVEVPLRAYAGFAPFDRPAERLRLLAAFNRLMPLDAQFADSRASGRPNLPLAAALAADAHLDRFLILMAEVAKRVKAEGG